jgi:hypothetical protein
VDCWLPLASTLYPAVCDVRMLGHHVLLLTEPAGKVCRETEDSSRLVVLRGFGLNVCDVEHLYLTVTTEESGGMEKSRVFPAGDEL